MAYAYNSMPNRFCSLISSIVSSPIVDLGILCEGDVGENVMEPSPPEYLLEYRQRLVESLSDAHNRVVGIDIALGALQATLAQFPVGR